MAEQKKTYITKMVVDHDGKRHPEGSEIELTAAQAESIEYAIKAKGDQKPEPTAEELRAKELDAKTVDQLKELAGEAEIDLGDASKKADIIQVIVEAETAKEGDE